MRYEPALFLHLVGVVLFFAGMAVATVPLVAARRRTKAGEIALLLGLTRWGVLLVAAGTVLIVGFGLWLVALTPWTLGDRWLVWSLALFAAAAVLGALGGQRPKRARILAGELPSADDVPTEVRALLTDRVSDVLNGSAAAGALVVLALMIWKP
jgi:uncharacterized membrane protein